MYEPAIGLGCFLIGPASATAAAATNIRKDGTQLFISDTPKKRLRVRAARLVSKVQQLTAVSAL